MAIITSPQQGQEGQQVQQAQQGQEDQLDTLKLIAISNTIAKITFQKRRIQRSTDDKYNICLTFTFECFVIYLMLWNFTIKQTRKNKLKQFNTYVCKRYVMYVVGYLYNMSIMIDSSL